MGPFPQNVSSSLTVQGSRPWIDVRTYGAAGNGVTDDTTAIRAALAAVPSGGATVFFPAGTYLIRPTTTVALRVTQSGTTIEGDGVASVIKVRDNVGNFAFVFTGPSPLASLTDITIRNITIDLNGANNPIAAATDLLVSTQGRIPIAFYQGERFRVEGCTFLNLQCVNALVFNGDSGSAMRTMRDIWIESNYFDVGGSNVNNDHSTTYTVNSDGVVAIRNNIFRSKAVGTAGAVTAIEVHGGGHVIEGNVISAYERGMYLTGVRSGNSTDKITCTYNLITDVCAGIEVLALYLGGVYTNEYVMQNLTVAHNQLLIERNGWAARAPTLLPEGIFLNVASDGTCRNVDICDNLVRFNPYTTGMPGEEFAAGIKWRSIVQRAGKYHENLRIAHNTIEYAPAQGINVSVIMVRQLQITDNVVINPGKFPTAGNDGFRNGLYLGGGGVLVGAEVSRNQLLDNQATPSLMVGIQWYGSVTDGDLLDNVVWVDNFSAVLVFYGSTNDGSSWHMRMSQRDPAAPTIWAKANSVIEANGVSFRQLTAPSGTNWVIDSESSGSAA